MWDLTIHSPSEPDVFTSIRSFLQSMWDPPIDSLRGSASSLTHRPVFRSDTIRNTPNFLNLISDVTHEKILQCCYNQLMELNKVLPLKLKQVLMKSYGPIPLHELINHQVRSKYKQKDRLIKKPSTYTAKLNSNSEHYIV